MPIPSEDPFITIPMVTPFSADDGVDHDAIAFNVERWLQTPLSGFIIGTASGEEMFLSEKEKLDIARTVIGSLDGERFLVGGIDCPSPRETLRRAEAFADAGAEMVRLRLPRGEDAAEELIEDVEESQSEENKE